MSIGLSLDDFLAGMSEAKRHAKMAIPPDRAMNLASIYKETIGVPSAFLAKVVNAADKESPRIIPAIAPKMPRIKPSNRKIRLAVRFLIPIAFRMPICLDFCITVIANTLAIPRTTESITNT